MTTLAAVTLVLAAAPVKLVVPDVQGVNITPELGRFYSTEVARFLRSAGLEVVSASDIASILGMERQKQLLGCGDGTSCMAELGSALGCDLILSLNIARLGGISLGVAHGNYARIPMVGQYARR